MVTDFSASEKDSGVKLRVLVRLLSAMSFSHFGELWLAGSHGDGITSGMSYIHLGKCLHTIHSWETTSQRGSLGSWNWPWLGRAVRIGGSGVA